MRTALRLLRRLDDIIGMVLMAGIILLACANVFMRYVYGKPWGWVEEITVFIFVWLIMFGASAVIKAEGHCSIDVLARKLSPKARRVLDIIVYLIVMTNLVLLIWYGTVLSIKAQSKITPILGIPYTYIDMAIPISSGIMLVYYGIMLWNEVMTGKIHRTQLEELIEDSVPQGEGEEEN